MPTTKSFEPVDAMDVRSQMGNLLDKVEFTQQRFIIQRRGKPKALLVPLVDRQTIEGRIDDEKRELAAIYDGLAALRGIIDDPNGHNASRSVDAYVYNDGLLNVTSGENAA